MRSVIGVRGMTCQNCVRHVTEALEELPGVEQVLVSLEQQTATVEHDTTLTPLAELERAVTEAGYETGMP